MFSIIKKFFPFSQSGRFEGITFIVCGIGNKGERYHNTRHNIGFSVIDAVLQNCRVLKQGKWCKSDVSIVELKSGIKIALVKPQTFVNRSGVAIKALLDLYKLTLTNCLVVVDDFNLTLGMLRIRGKGTHGGHNGLLSIITEVGNDFPRIRCGIGPLQDNTAVIDFVLSPFNEDELEKKNSAVKKAAEAILLFCESGLERAMNKYNR